MWIPGNAAEIEAAARRGDLEETPSFDAKVDLPVSKKNSSLAVDVAAMSTDGGVLLYGVGEDEHKRPTIPQPIALAGSADRVAQIVQTSIAEVPYFEPREFECDDDASKGYLLLIIPPSARAPHQVTVGGDLRFYGRGPKGNRILTEGEVARLYQRRQEWEQDRDALLAETVRLAPLPPQSGLAYLHAFARPVTADSALWERAESKAGRAALQASMATAAVSVKPNDNYAPSLKRGSHWRREGADEWLLTTQYERDTNARYIVDIRTAIDGRARLFCGRAGEDAVREVMPPPPPRMVLFESIIAGNLASFLAATAALYRASDYFASVDVGVRATNLRGGVSSLTLNPRYVFHDNTGYNGDEYSRHVRVAAAELDQPEQVARALLRRLFEAITGRDDLDPFS